MKWNERDDTLRLCQCLNTHWTGGGTICVDASMGAFRVLGSCVCVCVLECCVLINAARLQPDDGSAAAQWLLCMRCGTTHRFRLARQLTRHRSLSRPLQRVGIYWRERVASGVRLRLPGGALWTLLRLRSKSFRSAGRETEARRWWCCWERKSGWREMRELSLMFGSKAERGMADFLGLFGVHSCIDCLLWMRMNQTQRNRWAVNIVWGARRWIFKVFLLVFTRIRFNFVIDIIFSIPILLKSQI